MRIGEMNIHLKNMSKNQRAYWREMKRIYEEAIQDGFNITGQEFIEQVAHHGTFTRETIENVKNLTSETVFGYDREFDNAKMFIDNLIDDFSFVFLVTRRGRTRNKSRGEMIKLALGNRLKNLVSEYSYIVVYNAWMSMPYEIRAKIDSSVAAERYEGYEAALGIIDQLVSDTASGFDDYDGPEE